MHSNLHALQAELEDILADLQHTERRVRHALATLDSDASQRAVAGSGSVLPLEKESRGPVQSTRDPTRSAAGLDSQRASKAAEGSELDELGSAARTARSDTDDIECGKTYYRKNSGVSGEKIRVNKKVKNGTVVGDVYEITRIKADGKSITKRMSIGALRPILGDIFREKGESPFSTDAQRWPRTLSVHVLGGETVSIIVNQGDTILDVKRRIKTMRGTPVEAQTMYARRKIAGDSELCTKYMDETVFLGINANTSTNGWNPYSRRADMARNLAAAQDVISEKEEAAMRAMRRVQEDAPTRH